MLYALAVGIAFVGLALCLTIVDKAGGLSLEDMQATLGLRERDLQALLKDEDGNARQPSEDEVAQIKDLSEECGKLDADIQARVDAYWAEVENGESQ